MLHFVDLQIGQRLIEVHPAHSMAVTCDHSEDFDVFDTKQYRLINRW